MLILMMNLTWHISSCASTVLLLQPQNDRELTYLWLKAVKLEHFTFSWCTRGGKSPFIIELYRVSGSDSIWIIQWYLNTPEWRYPEAQHATVSSRCHFDLMFRTIARAEGCKFLPVLVIRKHPWWWVTGFLSWILLWLCVSSPRHILMSY